MKKSLPSRPAEESPKVRTRSIPKNTLAHRLFDTPALRGNSQRRPRVFSNDMNHSKLTPTIVKEYQTKKQYQTELLPPIDSNPRRNRMATEEADVEYF